ncbi:WEB family protein [Glycine max]|nr:WEB family protein [Glycine max]
MGRIGNWFFKKTSDFDSLRHVTQDVGGAKESLQKVTGQEDTPRSMVEDLRMELEKVQLWKSEFEQKGYLTGKSKARGALEEMILTLKQLREIQHMKNDTAKLKIKAAVAKLLLEDAETKVKVAVEEVEPPNAA